MATKKTTPKTAKKEPVNKNVIKKKTITKKIPDTHKSSGVALEVKDKLVKDKIAKPKAIVKEKTTSAVVKEIKKKKEKKVLGKGIKQIIDENTTENNSIKGIVNDSGGIPCDVEIKAEITVNEPIIEEANEVNIKETFDKITESEIIAEIVETEPILYETEDIDLKNIINKKTEVKNISDVIKNEPILIENTTKKEDSDYENEIRKSINFYGEILCDVFYRHWTMAMRGSIPMSAISEAIALADKSFVYETIVSDGIVSIKISKGGLSEIFPKAGAQIFRLE